MKKILSLLLALALALCITACSKNTENENANDTDTSEETSMTTRRTEKTTAEPKTDEEKGGKLFDKLGELLPVAEYKVTVGSKNGSFSAELVNDDLSEIYKNEASDEFKEIAQKNSADFVDGIREFYTDEIKLDYFEMRTVGGNTDEGVDSALYEAKYYNTQNQELTVICDSSGRIAVVKCNFTW